MLAVCSKGDVVWLNGELLAVMRGIGSFRCSCWTWSVRKSEYFYVIWHRTASLKLKTKSIIFFQAVFGKELNQGVLALLEIEEDEWKIKAGPWRFYRMSILPINGMTDFGSLLSLGLTYA